MDAIAVDRVRKRYGLRDVVDGVSFSVARGEVFCLVGPNGAGKSTLTEILEGYRLRDGGRAEVLGRDPGRNERALRDRIGIVLQDSGVQPEFSVRELLEMYGRYYSRHRDVDELLRAVGLDAVRDARTNGLSGGQRRRLDLALALVGDPEVLFLDEPTTGFDPAARREAWSIIRDLCARGVAVFLTTHQMDEASAVADRVAVMRLGRIVAMGTPAELAAGRAVQVGDRASLEDAYLALTRPDDDSDGARR